MATGTPNYAINPNGGPSAPVILSIGDASRTAPSSAELLVTAGANGSHVERLAMCGAGPTTASEVRIFKLDPGGNYHLYTEVAVQAVALAAGVPDWVSTLEPVTEPNLMPITLKTGWKLYATINDTQIAQEGNTQSIAQAQTSSGSGYLTLNGSNVVGASVAAVAAAATPTNYTPMTLTSTPYIMTNSAQLSLTSGANLSGINFLIIGRDLTGANVTESMAGPNNNTVFSVNVYKAIFAIIPLGTSANAVAAGISTVAGSTVLPLPSPILFTSGFNLSGVTLTIIGTSADGALLSEALLGPNVGETMSVNSYGSVTTIHSSGAIGEAIMVGNAAIMSGVSICVDAGDF